MNISEGLQKLIEAAFQDGKLSSKEKEILLNKAEKEGINKDEFDLYLSSLVHEEKKRKKVFYFYYISGKKQEYPIKQFIFGIGFLLLLIIIPLFFIYYEGENVDQHISKFDFSKAREVASSKPCRKEGNSIDGKFSCPRTLQLLKVFVAESQFLIENKEYEKAFSVIQEINGLESYSLLLNEGEISRKQSDYIDETIENIVLHVLNNSENYGKSKLMNFITSISEKDRKDKLIARIQNLK